MTDFCRNYVNIRFLGQSNNAEIVSAEKNIQWDADYFL